MYLNSNIKKYLDDLAARKPAPGGGSTAAAVGAVAAGLLSMAGNYTLSNKKYQKWHDEISLVVQKSEHIRKTLEKLIDKDVIAYNALSKAFKLPKNTPEQNKVRSERIQQELKQAVDVPEQVCNNLFEAVDLCNILIVKGNINLISDVGCAAEFISSAFAAALFNVKINLVNIKDEKFVHKIQNDLEIKQDKIRKLSFDISRKVTEMI
jgi:methenyltetrahydrofolate cyclohydrolase